MPRFVGGGIGEGRVMLLRERTPDLRAIGDATETEQSRALGEELREGRLEEIDGEREWRREGCGRALGVF